MYQRVNFSDFAQAFVVHGRKNHFSYWGLRSLFDYLEEQEQDAGEEMELNAIALCCDFVEYESFEEFQEDHPSIGSMEALRDKTVVLEFPGGLIVRRFKNPY